MTKIIPSDVTNLSRLLSPACPTIQSGATGGRTICSLGAFVPCDSLRKRHWLQLGGGLQWLQVNQKFGDKSVARW
jgi:hypothetical protein